MSNLQTRIQTLSIGEDSEIHWTIIADVPYMDFTTAAGAFLMGGMLLLILKLPNIAKR